MISIRACCLKCDRYILHFLPSSSEYNIVIIPGNCHVNYFVYVYVKIVSKTANKYYFTLIRGIHCAFLSSRAYIVYWMCFTTREHPIKFNTKKINRYKENIKWSDKKSTYNMLYVYIYIRGNSHEGI